MQYENVKINTDNPTLYTQVERDLHVDTENIIVGKGVYNRQKIEKLELAILRIAGYLTEQEKDKQPPEELEAVQLVIERLKFYAQHEDKIRDVIGFRPDLLVEDIKTLIEAYERK